MEREFRVVVDKNGIERILVHQTHYKRHRIIEENLLQYIDAVDMSERNKDIVKMYAGGENYKSIGEKHNISKNRVAQIVERYIMLTRRCK